MKQIIGPIGGLESCHSGLFMYMNRTTFIYYKFYNWINNYQRNTLQFKKVCNECKAIIVPNQISSQFLDGYEYKTSFLPEITYMPLATKQSTNYEKDYFLHVVWSGLAIIGKGLELLINIINNIEDDRIVFHLHTKGPLLKKLKEDISISKAKVIIEPFLSRDRFISELEKYDVGLITSYRELTSNVFIEYMHQNLYVLALKHCSFPDYIQDDINGYCFEIDKNLPYTIARYIETIDNTEMCVDNSIILENFTLRKKIGLIKDIIKNG